MKTRFNVFFLYGHSGQKMPGVYSVESESTEIDAVEAERLVRQYDKTRDKGRRLLSDNVPVVIESVVKLK